MSEKKESQYAFWAKSSQSPCFPYTSMPAYAVMPLFPCLFYLRLWTLIIAVIAVGLIWYMSNKGYTLTWLGLRLKGRLAGNRYSSRPPTHVKRFSRADWRYFD